MITGNLVEEEEEEVGMEEVGGMVVVVGGITMEVGGIITKTGGTDFSSKPDEHVYSI